MPGTSPMTLNSSTCSKGKTHNGTNGDSPTFGVKRKMGRLSFAHTRKKDVAGSVLMDCVRYMPPFIPLQSKINDSTNGDGNLRNALSCGMETRHSMDTGIIRKSPNPTLLGNNLT
jgi:hypothetical protein